MQAFTTLVGQYNSSLLSLTDGDFSIIALDSSSRIIQDHSTSSIKIGDGTNILDVLVEDTAYAGSEKGIGFVGVRKDTVGTLVSADGDWTFAQFDSDGRLRVDAEVSVSTGSDKAEDSAHTTADVGCFNLSIRMSDITADNSALLAGTNGDYQGTFTNDKGELYTIDTDAAAILTTIDTVLDNIYIDTTSIDGILTALSKAEDSGHSSGDQGIMSLGVVNENLDDLADTEKDYVAQAFDKKGRAYIVNEPTEPGTDADIGVDESNDGEIDIAYHATNFTTIATITVGAGETLKLKSFEGSTDVLTAFRLCIFDDSVLDTVIRKYPVTENLGSNQWTFERAREVVGSATITVELQARCMRNNKTAHVGGGINAYK